MSVRYNVLSPELKANPYPAYSEMRRSAPICQVDPGGMWAVSRYDDVMYVLKNPQLFSSDGFRQISNPPWLGGNPLAESIICLDPPRHGQLRAIINRAFSSAALARLEPRVQALAEQVVAELPLEQPVDIVPLYALRIPASVLGLLMGLDPSLHLQLKQWADLVTAGVSTVRSDEDERQQVARKAVAELKHYFSEMLEQRRREPGDDLVSGLLQARVDGEALTQDELLAFLFLLLVAGIESTMSLLSSSLMVLQERPELLARLRADRSLIPAFIEEVLRYEPPTHSLPRIITQDAELGGVRLPKGARLLILLASASRDEAHFPDAERFDMDRRGPQNLPFGHGIHFCLGAPLARMEGRLALEALLHRCGRLEHGPEPLTWYRSMTIRGPASLSLVLHPAQ
jgi:cytochrome P450